MRLSIPYGADAPHQPSHVHLDSNLQYSDQTLAPMNDTGNDPRPAGHSTWSTKGTEHHYTSQESQIKLCHEKL